MFDVLVMSWAPGWGAGRFLPVTMVISAVLSTLFLPFAGKIEGGIFSKHGRPLLGGAFFIGLQATFLVSCLAVFGDATAVNVIYSTRGLWSVLAVWWLGHLFANTERARGAQTFRNRLIGAVCLCAAVGLVFV